MGEMIKFGIKLAMTIACAVALMAAILILYNLISSYLPNSSGTGFGYVRDMFRLVSLIFPLNLNIVFTIISSLFAFKVAYWAADKMIQFISASS